MVMIGVAGTVCSGKGAVADFFKQKGFYTISLSDLIREEARSRNLEVNRENLQKLGNELREKFGPNALAVIALERCKDKKDVIIESIRNPGEVEEFKKYNKDFKLIAINALREIRLERALKRFNESERKEDPILREEIIAKMDIDEGKNQSSSGQQVLACMDLADFFIHNDKSLEFLYSELEHFLKKLNTPVRPSWDEYFMNVAHVVKERATCSTRKVGAVLVRDKRIIATGYNGTPKGLKHCYEGGCERCEKRLKGLVQSGVDLDKCACSHGEENAIVQAAFHGISTKDATLYTTNYPCTQCAKMIINSGIPKIVCDEYYSDELGTILLKSAGVEIINFKELKNKTIKKVGALIIFNKHLLIVKPHGKPFFINPGGKYEQKETAEECLKRELKEELKMSLIDCKYYKTYKINKAAHNNRPLELELYFVTFSSDITPSSEIEIAEWMSKEDFLNKKFNVAPSFYEYIPDLIKDNFL